jgi:hypothetical protein
MYKYKSLYKYRYKYGYSDLPARLSLRKVEVGRVESASRICDINPPAPCGDYEGEGHRSSVNFNLVNIPEGTTELTFITKTSSGDIVDNVNFSVFKYNKGKFDDWIYEVVKNNQTRPLNESATTNLFIGDPSWEGWSPERKNFWVYVYANIPCTIGQEGFDYPSFKVSNGPYGH